MTDNTREKVRMETAERLRQFNEYIDAAIDQWVIAICFTANLAWNTDGSVGRTTSQSGTTELLFAVPFWSSLGLYNVRAVSGFFLWL